MSSEWSRHGTPDCACIYRAPCTQCEERCDQDEINGGVAVLDIVRIAKAQEEARNACRICLGAGHAKDSYGGDVYCRCAAGESLSKEEARHG